MTEKNLCFVAAHGVLIFVILIERFSIEAVVAGGRMRAINRKLNLHGSSRGISVGTKFSPRKPNLLASA